MNWTNTGAVQPQTQSARCSVAVVQAHALTPITFTNLQQQDQHRALVLQRRLTHDDDAAVRSAEAIIRVHPIAIHVEERPQCEKLYCKDCDFWFNGAEQFKDHRTTRKHKKNVKSEPAVRKLKGGVVTPVGTALIIEQSAIHADAVRRWML